ncbi:hypothetical protein C8J57DRAFT_1245667 [Mycena rebaudengoi]|nr:hypothetical protein C8J57DRAFT_1245667 [Mycena rebaudengoi]
MHESPRTSSASTDEVSQVTRLARWAWTLRAQHNAKRRVARVCDFGLKKPLDGEVLDLKKPLSDKAYHLTGYCGGEPKSFPCVWSPVRICSCIFLGAISQISGPKKPLSGQPFEIFALKKPLLGQGKREIFRLKKPLSGQSLAGVSRGLGKWRTSAALDGWSWAGHRVHHVVWVVQGIEHATSGGSGGGVKRKELMDSSMTLAQTGTNMAREFPYWEHVTRAKSQRVMSDEGILVRQKISKAIWSYKTTGDLFSFAF